MVVSAGGTGSTTLGGFDVRCEFGDEDVVIWFLSGRMLDCETTSKIYVAANRSDN